MTATRKPRKPRQVPPPVGAVYLMPLPDGSNRFGACRVVQRREKEGREPAKALVAACAWTGDAPLDADAVDERLRPLLVLTHHAHKQERALIWIYETVPDEFTLLGTLAPTDAEARTLCGSSSGWAWLPYQALAQWRWDNERETVLREEAEKAASDAATLAARREELAANDRREKDAMTLESLRAETGLEDWRGMVPPAKIKATRAILLRTLDELGALDASGDASKVRPALRILRQCVLSLNDLDSPKPFIETTIREELCELIDKMAYVVGIRPTSDDSLCDRWREW